MNKPIALLFLFFSSLIFSQDKIILIDENFNSETTELPFSVIEEIPAFPGCEEVDKTERHNCFNAKMSEHITTNFIYPKIAAKKKIQGKVLIQFIIDRDGSITDIRTSGADPILQTEAYRIFTLLPQMKPGIQKGKPIKVKYALPLNFRLK